ncbi:ly-6/neurotoxin-like protein 1 isoform X1 [Macaca nemestrina]|uniref:ly-6/neurotoxin-like protein 1 isoform X1 n=1 Tax=Macaca nemestrina TaxID=9545 RepID=UPI0039B92335
MMVRGTTEHGAALQACLPALLGGTRNGGGARGRQAEAMGSEAGAPKGTKGRQFRNYWDWAGGARSRGGTAGASPRTTRWGRVGGGGCREGWAAAGAGEDSLRSARAEHVGLRVARESLRGCPCRRSRCLGWPRGPSAGPASRRSGGRGRGGACGELGSAGAQEAGPGRGGACGELGSAGAQEAGPGRGGACGELGSAGAQEAGPGRGRGGACGELALGGPFRGRDWAGRAVSIQRCGTGAAGRTDTRTVRPRQAPTGERPRVTPRRGGTSRW